MGRGAVLRVTVCCSPLRVILSTVPLAILFCSPEPVNGCHGRVSSCIVTGEDKTTTSGAAAESRVTVVSDFLGGDRDRSEDPRTVEVGT